MRSAPTGASARAVNAFLSRYAARALFAATVAVALLSGEVAAEATILLAMRRAEP